MLSRLLPRPTSHRNHLMRTIDTLRSEFNYYLSELSRAVAWQWHHMTPTKYMVLLVSIFVFGWILLRHGIRQY